MPINLERQFFSLEANLQVLKDIKGVQSIVSSRKVLQEI